MWWFGIISGPGSQLLNMNQAARPDREQQLARTESRRCTAIGVGDQYGAR